MTFKPEPVIDFWDIFVPNDYWNNMQRTGDIVLGEPVSYAEPDMEMLTDAGWEATEFSGTRDDEFPLEEIYDEFAMTHPQKEFVAIPTDPIVNDWMILSREYSGS